MESGQQLSHLTFLALVAFSVLGMIFSPQLAPLVAYNFTGEQRDF